MTDQQKLQSFLRDYAAMLRDDSMLKDYAPFSCRIQMAAGACVALDKNGNLVASFGSQWQPDGKEFAYNPAMPILPQAIGFCELFVAAANAVFGYSASEATDA